MGDQLIMRQLFDRESCTYTYLLADPGTGEAVLIDPVLGHEERDMGLVKELGLTLKYVLETHVHADHVTGAKLIREETGALMGISSAANVSCADLQLKDGGEVKFGPFSLKVLETPGHTAESVSYSLAGMVFTGDTMLIRGCGRADFQNGSPEELYDSIMQKLFILPDETKVYPGHDYNGRTCSTIGEEKKYNPRIFIGQTKEAFAEIMNNLNLPKPKKLDIAVPANLRCGEQ